MCLCSFTTPSSLRAARGAKASNCVIVPSLDGADCGSWRCRRCRAVCSDAGTVPWRGACVHGCDDQRPGLPRLPGWHAAVAQRRCDVYCRNCDKGASPPACQPLFAFAVVMQIAQIITMICYYLLSARLCRQRAVALHHNCASHTVATPPRTPPSTSRRPSCPTPTHYKLSWTRRWCAPTARSRNAAQSCSARVSPRARAVVAPAMRACCSLRSTGPRPATALPCCTQPQHTVQTTRT